MGRERWLLGVVLLTGAVWGALGAGPEEPALSILPALSPQTKPKGRNALLTCRASGANANLVTGLRWRGPDLLEVPQPPAGATRPPVYAESFGPERSLSLVFQKLEHEHAGNYTCEAEFAGGPPLRKVVEIRVIQAITFEDAPTEQYPTWGQRYLIRCRVAAEPAATVDWLKEDVPVPAHYSPKVDGLLIPNATDADDGFYTCRAIVLSTGELQTRVIRVEVHVPPRFENGGMPRNESVTASRDAAIECKADGRPPPKYTWVQHRTGLDLTKAGGRFLVDPITGTLRITPAQADDDGEYSCKGTNAAGYAEQTVFIRVAVPPRVAAVVNLTQAEGQIAELKCEARGRPPPEISWRRVGEDQSFSIGVQQEDMRISTTSRAVGGEHPDRSDGSIVWSDVKRVDDGLYTCIARNEAGTAEANAHLTVEFKPSFANTPYDKIWSWDNKRINLTCLAESIPNATIHWKYNNRDIEKPHFDMFFKKYGEGPQSWLELVPTPEKGYATYTCVATNKLGVEEHEIILYRADIPGALNQAVFDVVTATTIKFKLHGPSSDGGIPTLTYSVRYRPLDGGFPSDQWKEETWPAESSYILEGLEPQRRYAFEFAATNEVGTGPWGSPMERVMPKRSPPEAPRLLHRTLEAETGADPSMPDDPLKPVQSAYPNIFQLRWQIPADNGEKIIEYVITICPARLQGEVWKKDTSSGHCYTKNVEASDQSTSYRIQHLKPGMHYLVELKARNRIGLSEGSVLQLRTAPGAPSNDPGPAEVATGQKLSSALIIVIVVGALLVLLLVVDVSCFACNRAGIIAALCERARGKEAPDESSAVHTHAHQHGGIRLGASHSKEPMRDEMRPLTLGRPPSVKRDTSVGLDGKTSVNRSAFVGRDSAV